ncbi:hypothetical protein CHA_P10037 [Pseudomonas phage CHA_P1]|uniref:Uncharacterized protein n=1 Tax=Pseudomonas phage CHA_P1 TaxID=1327965 RepID=V5JW17_9CAUD|nr:hypothetical protein X837_gp037 [Pseudomonas phage CHA_P1]AGR88991.1 hypothetical protein CHA_P10037 [Pseudomonas phage CHA_P1]
MTEPINPPPTVEYVRTVREAPPLPPPGPAVRWVKEGTTLDELARDLKLQHMKAWSVVVLAVILALTMMFSFLGMMQRLEENQVKLESERVQAVKEAITKCEAGAGVLEVTLKGDRLTSYTCKFSK